MTYFVPLIGSNQTRTVIRGRMAKEGSSERRVRGNFPWVEVSLGRVHCLSLGTMSSACPFALYMEGNPWALFTAFSVKGMLSQKGHEASAKADKCRSSPRNADQSETPGFVLETPVSWR